MCCKAGCKVHKQVNKNQASEYFNQKLNMCISSARGHSRISVDSSQRWSRPNGGTSSSVDGAMMVLRTWYTMMVESR